MADDNNSIIRRSQRELGRVRRNWRPLASPLWSIFRAKDEAAREEGLRGLVNWIGRKRVDPWRKEGDEALKGFPRAYLESHLEIRERLDGTHHLGMLEELGFAQVSRLDYTLLQARNLLALKKAHPNLGLSSPALKAGGRSLSGLELAQLWAILHNSGHLFGTFATERGLLFYIKDRADLQDQLLGATDECLRDHVREILGKSQIYKCSQAVAAWEASQEAQSEIREVCVAALLAYVRSGEDASHGKLKWVFKRVRQFSYLQLHAPLGIGMQQGFSIPDETPGDLIGHPSFTYEAHAREEGDLALLLDSINEFQHRSFFTSPPASLAVLRHLREFKYWWRDCDRQVLDANDRLRQLFSRPSGWQRAEQDGLVHVCRLELEGIDDEWRQEVKSWHADGIPWGQSNFLISHIPGMPGLLCDVFGHSKTLPSEVTAQVFSQLAIHSERSWKVDPTGAAKRLWRSVGAFGISLFNQALEEGKRAVLAPAAATNGSIGYAVVGRTSARALERLNYFVGRTTNDVRRGELTAVAHDIEARPYAGVTFVFLGAVKIYGNDDDNELGEVDGLWATVNGGELRWRALEVKSGNTTSGVVGQIEKLRGLLCVASTELQITKIAGAKYSATDFGIGVVAQSTGRSGSSTTKQERAGQ